MRRPFAFRTRILAVVLAGGVIPLLVVGLWLTRIASRSGEALLERRLQAALDRGVLEVSARWVRERAALVSYSEDPGLWRPAGNAGIQPPQNVVRAAVQDSSGLRWVGPAPALQSEPVLPVSLAVFDPLNGRPRGALRVELRSGALLGGLSAAGAAFGATMAALDRGSGTSLLALPFDPVLLERGRFQWGGEEWAAHHRGMEEPPLVLIAAAPVTAFTKPFEAAAAAGTLALALVALTSLGMAALLTIRLTRRLGGLAGAADAIALGQLDRRVEIGAADEVGRVARAFNTMTESLQRTLAELAQRQSLAAVGEFASALAHEIRNPLTAVRLDLQRVEEALPADAPARVTQRRALHAVDRLDRIVSGALRIARSGRVTRTPIDLVEVLRAAMATAAPEFASRRAILDPLPAEQGEVQVAGDASALEQVFLNLLLNAAQALEPGSRAGLELSREAGAVMVAVWDQGGGIPAENLATVFDLFFSTRPDGTGLGLSIARQIVLAHGGTIAVTGDAGRGTTVRVTLPATPALVLSE